MEALKGMASNGIRQLAEMELVLSVVVILLLLIVLVFGWGEKGIVKLATFAVAGFFMFYVIISLILFCFHAFSIIRALLVELICSAGLAAVFMIPGFASGRLKKVEKGKAGKDKADYWPVYVVIILLVVFTRGSFGFYGMGQDQGVYQTEAIRLYYDQNDWETVIDDYQEVPDEEYQEYCRSLIADCLGFDLVSDESLSYHDLVVSTMNLKSSSELDGYYHGIPSYAALLGLSARINGIPGMMLIGHLCYFLVLLILSFLLEELSVDRKVACLLVLLYGICPQMVWNEKSSLTETVTSLFVISYLYFITQKDDRWKSLAVFPIAAFSFFHVSIYTVLPVFVLNEWILFIKSGKKRFIRDAVLILVSYLCGFLAMVRIQPRYVILNYYRPLRVVPMNWIIPLFTGGTFVLILVSLLLPSLKKKTQEKAVIHVGEQSSSAEQQVITEHVTTEHAATERASMEHIAAVINIGAAILYRAGIILAVVAAVFQAVVRGTEITQLTLVCYTFLSGIVLIPLISWRMWKGYAGTPEEIIVGNVFFWCILLYSAVMRPRCSYYYYYTRYLVPYISVIIVMFAFLYCRKNNNPAERKDDPQKHRNGEVAYKYGKYGLCTVLAAGIIFLLPHTMVILRNQDDTRMQWNCLTDILEQVSEGDIVYLDPEEMGLLYHPLRARNVTVYPVKDDLQKTLSITEIRPEERTVFYITNSASPLGSTGLAGGVHLEKWFSVSYANQNTVQEDDLSMDSRFTGMPFGVTSREDRYVIWQSHPEQTRIEADRDFDSFVAGFAAPNTSGYRWMNASFATIGCYLEKKDMIMTIQQGDIIPSDQSGKDDVSVLVKINGKEIGSLYILADQINENLKVRVPAEYLNEGYNEFQFETGDLWSPSEYGSADHSNYVFSLKSVTFESLP